MNLLPNVRNARPGGRGSLIVASLVVGTVLVASACDADDSSFDAGDRMAEGASWGNSAPLLDEDDLGFTYEESSSFEDEDLTRAGCLSSVEGLAQTADRQMTATFTTDNPFDSPFIRHSVYEFGGSDAAASAIADWKTTAENCDSVDYYENDALLTLDVVTDTESLGAAVDEEVNTMASGSVDTDHVGMDMNQWVSVARVGSHLSVVQVLDLDEDDAIDEGHRLTELLSNRLDVWAADRDTDEETR